MTRFQKIAESLKPFTRSLESFAEVLSDSDYCPPGVGDEKCAMYAKCVDCCREYLLEEVE